MASTVAFERNKAKMGAEICWQWGGVWNADDAVADGSVPPTSSPVLSKANVPMPLLAECKSATDLVCLVGVVWLTQGCQFKLCEPGLTQKKAFLSFSLPTSKATIGNAHVVPIACAN